MFRNRARAEHHSWQPVHVTLRARLSPLRSQFVFPSVRMALVRATRRDPARFRVVHFSVQRDHVHLVVEAADARALSSGVSGLMIRVARYVNDLLARQGSLWADRWHGRALRTPREVRNAIVYVLANARKHARIEQPPGIDPYSSALWFDGWSDSRYEFAIGPPMAPAFLGTRECDAAASPAPSARDFATHTWLGRVGWRRYGLIATTETPK